jgi:hypothetical protein
MKRPARQGLYDPQFEHESCGVGFVANMKGVKSHQIVEQGLSIGRPATGLINILDAQNKAAAELFGPLIGAKGRKGMAAMQQTGRGGGKAGGGTHQI